MGAGDYCFLDSLDGGSGALAESLQHTFFVIFRRKMQAYAGKVRIDDPKLASHPARIYRAEKKGIR
jgi:hypothetical protein